MRTLAIVHCYYPDLWAELAEGLRALGEYYALTIKVSGTEGRGLPAAVRAATRLEDCEVVELPNRGLDIGPFLHWCDVLGDELYGYRAVLKLHGKKSPQTHPRHHRDGSVWRRDLIHPLCYRSGECLRELLRPDVGMVARASWVCPAGDWINHRQVTRYRALGGVFPRGDTPEHWVAGTMFWARPEIFKPFFSRVSPRFLYRELEANYFTDWHEGRNTHALERIFGYLNAASGLRVVGL